MNIFEYFFSNLQKESNDTSPAKLNLVEEIDVQQYLMLKKDSEDGPDVKGGELDALIVHATKVQKFSENGKYASGLCASFAISCDCHLFVWIKL